MTETHNPQSPETEPNELIVALQREQQRRESAEHKRRTAHRAIVGAAVKVLAGEPATQPKATALDEALAALELSILDLQLLADKLKAFRVAEVESDSRAAEQELKAILERNGREWAELERVHAETQAAMVEARARHFTESVVAKERADRARYGAPAKRDMLRADLESAGVQL